MHEDAKLNSRNNILSRLYVLPNNRLFWLFMVLIAISLNAVAIYYQLVLEQYPCELCIYQRFGISIITIACIIIMINPNNKVIYLLGMLLLVASSLYGLNNSIKQIYIASYSENLFLVCSLKPKFPFNLAVDEWLPILFKPLADCRAEAPDFIGLPMPYWMLLIFVLYCKLCIFCIYIKWFRK